MRKSEREREREGGGGGGERNKTDRQIESRRWGEGQNLA